MNISHSNYYSLNCEKEYIFLPDWGIARFCNICNKELTTNYNNYKIAVKINQRLKKLERIKILNQD